MGRVAIGLIGIGLLGASGCAQGGSSNEASSAVVDVDASAPASAEAIKGARGSAPTAAPLWQVVQHNDHLSSYDGVAKMVGSMTMTQMMSYPKPPMTPVPRHGPRENAEHDDDVVRRSTPPADATPEQLGFVGRHRIDAPLASPPVTASFIGATDDHTVIPPDTDGAVGPNHVVTILNDTVRIQDRAGNVLSDVALTGFYASLGIAEPFDPNLIYDPYANRWVAVADAEPQKPTAQIVIGVSATSDPTGKWNFFSFKIDKNSLNWADFPLVGFNKNWIVVTMNLFSAQNNPLGNQIFAIDKNGLYSAPDKGTVGYKTFLENDGTYTIAPARVYDQTLETVPLVGMWDGGNGQVSLYTIGGTVGAETLKDFMFAGSTPSLPWQDSLKGKGKPPNVNDVGPQLGDPRMINAGDSRMQKALYRNGSIWAAHNIYLPATGDPTRVAIQWWEIDATTNVVKQQGRIDDPTATQMFAYPGIAVNKFNDVVIGYTRFAASQYASANYSYRASTDALNTMHSDVVMKTGEGAYYSPDAAANQNPRNRWGDYSNAWVDPVDDVGLWALQEYAAVPVNGVSVWSTWWGKLQTVCDDKPDGTVCDAPSDLCASATCQNKVCVAGAKKVCANPDQCHTATCDSKSGQCVAVNAADGTTCTDTNKCTKTAACSAGACKPTASVTCPAGDACNDPGTCDPATGTCAKKQKADGTTCSDGNKCVANEKCAAGVCSGQPLDCAAPDECHIANGCDPASGCKITAKPDGTACSTGTCTAGACVAAPPTQNNPTPAKSGCGCRTVPTEGGAAGLLLAGVGIAAAFARRRRAK